MADFTSLNGYNVKDAVSRAYGPRIDALEAKELNFELTELYIRANTGDDENDGLTRDTAFKTLDRAFEEVKKGNLNVNFKIMEAGNYYVNYKRFCDFTWHITGHQAGINIYFTQDDPVFYSMHVNFSAEAGDLTFTTAPTIWAGGNGLYQDSGYCLFRGCTFKQRYSSHGGELTMINCHISSVQTDRTLADLRSMYVDQTDGTSYVFDFDHASVVATQSSFHISDVLAGKKAFLRVAKSTLYWISSVTDNTAVTLPDFAIEFQNGDITSSASTKTRLLQIGNAVEDTTQDAVYNVRTWNTTPLSLT